MRLPTRAASLTSLLLFLVSFASAEKKIYSNSLVTCQDDSGFSASYFDVVFTPDNSSIYFDIVGISTISGNITAKVTVSAYGYEIIDLTLNPCTLGLTGLCPLSAGDIDIESNLSLDSSVTSDIPGIAYSVPNIDGVVKVVVYSASTGDQVACVTATLSNGQTVYQKAVGWVTAVIAGLALLVSAVTSGLGHSNTAAHIAANAMSLFGFFQAQALFGMTAVDLPPIVQAWTQNFQWSMGIIRVGFIESICTWYQQATGGTPSTLLSDLSTISVNVQKRDLKDLARLVRRGISAGVDTPSFAKRSAELARRSTAASSTVTVYGIERVGFVAGLEISNVFMTGYIFFIIFVVFVILAVVATRFILEALAKTGRMRKDRFLDFRNGWSTILRGILFRLVLIGFPQMVVLCFWELTKKDSAGEEALAVVTILTMIVMLVWACTKVWMLAKRSIAMHKNPAYILYSDPVALHKWGFLYVQFKATAYWFIMPLLAFILLRGLFIAFGQDTGITQAVAFLILEASLLLGTVILRPYMDKKTNAFNISICIVNLFSSIFLLFFSDVFGVPGLVTGIMGVIFAFGNAVFALVLLIMILIAITYAIFSKDPDVRYQPMRDDRGSFIKSQTQLTTELDALGATARGENKVPFKPRDIDEDSYSGSSWDGNQAADSGGNYQAIAEPYNKELGSGKKINTAYDSSPYASSTLSANQTPSRSQTTSPWQRGAGYDHR